MKKKTIKTRIAIKVEDDLINDVKNMRDGHSRNDSDDLFPPHVESLGEPADLFASTADNSDSEESEPLEMDPSVFETMDQKSQLLDLTRAEDKTIALPSTNKSGAEEKGSEVSQSSSHADDKTVAVAGMARVVDGNKNKAKSSPEVKTKVSYGAVRASARTGAATAMTSPEATFLQADNLRIAQSRILELEKELERVRAENEELASAGETMRRRSDDLQSRLGQVDQEKREAKESLEAEIHLLKNSIQYKEIENRGLRAKVEELEGRLSSDLKKIRLRERELENRLELLKMEKTALIQSKDDALLDLKRKMDQLKIECDNYRNKCQELNKNIDQNQEQIRRTVRALRLALTNLEVGEDTVYPIKKAE
ncbi:MAG: hypothetical protein AB7O96_04915 [Pseudobdellovibrionaceae bacterium]